MTERHPYIGELTVENVDRFLTRMARERLAHVIYEHTDNVLRRETKNELSFDVAILRAGDCGISTRKVLEDMISDGTVVKQRATRDAEGKVLQPAGLYLNADHADAG